MAWWNEWLKGFNNLDTEEKEPSFTDNLVQKGFRYNETHNWWQRTWTCLLYTSPSPRDGLLSRMPSSA